MSANNMYERLYEIIRGIPKGKVATYGQVARLAGMAGHARQVGYALHALPDRTDVPWHRVINARGQISLDPHDVASSLQKALLKKEGIRFNADDRISLAVYGWRC